MIKALKLIAFCCISATVASAADPPIPSHPYQKSVNTDNWIASGGGSSNSSASFSGIIWSIPADKILVVEHVSARVRVNPGEKVNVVVACLSSPAIEVGLSSHQIVLSSAGQFDGLERLVGSAPLRCYTSSNFQVGFIRNSVAPVSVTAGVEFSVTGYLVDPPKQ